MPVAVGIMADSYKAPVSSFDPLSIPWHSAFWASDPGWTPPADGAAVSSWRNSGTSAANATQATGTAQPTFRSAYANLNGKPAVDFDGTADWLITASPLIAQPNHIVVVGWLDPSHAPTPFTCDSGAGTRHMLRLHESPNNALMYAGAAPTITGAGVTGSHAVLALFNGAASAFRKNGTAYTVPSTVGAEGLQSLCIGSQGAGTPAAYYKGGIAFFAVSDTTLTAQQITDLETWAKNFYGVPIP